MIRKILILAFLFIGTTAYSQSYNNEWIDFSKTYYKFKVAVTGLYRIDQATLNSAGLGAIPAEQFKLFRNGVEVPVYTSVSTGILPANGYIELWAEANDGKPDKQLYRDPAYQHSEKWNLQTDTVVFFLTSSIGTNLRLNEIANDVAGNSLPAEPYFLHKAGTHFRTRLNPGEAVVVGEYVYSSSYDRGEFQSSPQISPGAPLTDVQNNLYVAPSGPDPVIFFGASGNALNARSVRVHVNNLFVKESSMDYFLDTVTSGSFPLATLSSGSASVQFYNISSVSTDRMVVSFYDIRYPRQFNFDNAKNFSFQLPAKAQGYYLQISNFNNGTQNPVLYDLNNRQRIVGQVSGGFAKFVLPGSSVEKRLVLVNAETTNITYVNSLVPKNFINFSLPANQSDYLIVSSPLLYNGTNGINPVDEYRKYRSSSIGGGYNAKIYEIDELVDQFAFGIKKHPLSVKNFLRYARAVFTVPPKFTFLIGRGVTYTEYRNNQSSPFADRLNIIPTFGYPASDNLLSSPNGATPYPETPIGRLSVVAPKEIEDYLEKMKEYEDAQINAPNTIADRLWMKNIIEVTGSSDLYLGTILCNYMQAYRDIAIDTLIGSRVTIFCKTSTNPLEKLPAERIAELFAEGLSMVTYFGHSSSTTLEFNLDNPASYENQGKYPIFSVNGCNAGNFFTFDPQRFSFNETLSEKFVLAKQRGGIAFIASTHYGIVNYLNIFITDLYTEMANPSYGASLGIITRNALKRIVTTSGTTDFYARLHAEEITIHGDPALKMNFQNMPDYVIEEPQVRINPSFISIAAEKCNVDIKMFNLGKAIKDSIAIEVKRQFPDGSTTVIYKKNIRGVFYSDSLHLEIPVIATRDKGLNKLIITLDADNNVDEISESNNVVVKEFFIYEDEAKPVYPYNYSVITKNTQKLFASTANPFSLLKQYVMEIDTTQLFNSSLKVSKNISTTGGVLEFDPGITFKDSVVYYWRTSMVPAPGDTYRWNIASFVYINGSSPGFSQSHYFQHANSDVAQISLLSSRDWKFGTHLNNIFMRNGMYPVANTDNDFSVSLNGNTYIFTACVGRSLVFNIFDPISFKPWKNVDANGNNLYRFNSLSANCFVTRNYNFEFSYMSSASRKHIMDFMDSIPKGFFVAIRSFDYDYNNSFSSTWRGDTTLYGSNKSLYHKLLLEGFTTIDLLNQPRSWIMFYKKGDTEFSPKVVVSNGIHDRISLNADCPTPDTLGYITSPAFGPARAWKRLQWRGFAQETGSADRPTIDVLGIDEASGSEVPLMTLNESMQDVDISGISAAQFPYLKLKMRNQDSVTLTPYQLKSWKLDYDPVPEGAVSPNIFFTTKDTLEVGEKLDFGVAFKNVSQTDFDSLDAKLMILDKDNVAHPVPVAKLKKLLVGDTVKLMYQIDTKDYPELNTIFLDFNPDNKQPEQYLFNNFIFRNFYVKPDKINPLLDVTFDGVHILNRDIVSAKPRIQIKLKDEARFMLLNDTSLFTLQVKFPDQNNTIRTYNFDNDTVRFIPAKAGTDNTATIEFSPYFSEQFNADGDEYELIVKGKDKSGNKAGVIEYRVTFRIISKPMISNLLNYPNPFTTSTAFVFTITGSEIPQNMKIQILTVTGKIVREITKDELGPLRVGRNITEFKWNGTDQFGQRLANGVYLYRVVTTMNGKQMEKYKAEGDNTDKYFQKGYGKMYLMR